MFNEASRSLLAQLKLVIAICIKDVEQAFRTVIGRSLRQLANEVWSPVKRLSKCNLFLSLLVVTNGASRNLGAWSVAIPHQG